MNVQCVVWSNITHFRNRNVSYKLPLGEVVAKLPP